MALSRATVKRVIAAGALGVGALASGSLYYGLSPLDLTAQGGRVILAHLAAAKHAGDRAGADEIRRGYYIGGDAVGGDSSAGWRVAEGRLQGFKLIMQQGGEVPQGVPFVYQPMDAPYLVELRDRCGLRSLTGKGDEYHRMLRLFHWVGTRWDHGMDPLPNHFYPLAAVRAAEEGARLPCYVSAKLVVHAASSLGWPARLVSLSRDGYNWEHAVAEVWSNRFRKWFVVDCDYNIIYEAQGVPLSAFELCHLGPGHLKERRLSVRRIAPDKPSVRRQNLLPYYSYVQIDLRNDWLERTLERGSPEGGDLATYWTSRRELPALLTAKRRVDEGENFDWPVNAAGLRLVGVERGAHSALLVEPFAYSPYFASFALSIDHGAWLQIPPGRVRVPIRKGTHSLRARVVTRGGDLGAPCEVRYRFD